MLRCEVARVRGCEGAALLCPSALACWRHPRRGSLAPARPMDSTATCAAVVQNKPLLYQLPVTTTTTTTTTRVTCPGHTPTRHHARTHRYETILITAFAVALILTPPVMFMASPAPQSSTRAL